MWRLALLLLLVPGVAWAIPNTETLPPACTVATMTDGSCVPVVEGVIVRVTDGADENDCTVGLISTTVACQYDGSAWVKAGTSTTFTGANDDTITNTPDGTFLFTIDEAGPATLTCADTAGACPMTYDAGTDGPIIIGSADIDSITLTVDGTADADLVLPLTSVGAGEIVADSLDFAQMSDTLALDAATSITGTAGEVLSITRTLTDQTDEDGITLSVTAEDTGPATTAQYGMQIINVDGSTEALDALLTLDALDTDDTVTYGVKINAAFSITNAIDASDAQIVNALNTGSNPIVSGANTLQLGGGGGASTTDTWLYTDGLQVKIDNVLNELTLVATSTNPVVIMAADAASPADLLIDTTDAGTITVGSADVLSVPVITDGGTVTLDGTIVAAGQITSGGIFTASGAAIYDAGGAAGIVLGSADVTTLNITNNGALVVGAAATTDSVTIESAGAITIGTSVATSVPIVTDGGTVTIDGTVVAPLPIVSLATGALTVNTVHLATAAATYDMPDSCDSATGNWVTVAVQDINEVVIIHPFSGDTLHPAGIVISTDHVVDSSGDATTGDGDFITFVCLSTNNWYSTAIGGAWIDGGAS